MFSVRDRLLVAVSGGIDSVVLCHLLLNAGYRFIISHCNFQLRGDESERDENFVRALAADLNLPVMIKRFDTNKYATEQKLSIQEAARDLRYQWFHECLKSSEFIDYFSSLHKNKQVLQNGIILTAHHRDDNIETMLLNFFRGTGISGLKGMLPARDNIMRPLLFCSRERISDYAKQHELKWVEDSSNVQTKYSRNFIRHKIIPQVEELIPSLKENLAGNIERFRETSVLFEEIVAGYRKKLLEQRNGEWMIPVEKLGLQKVIPTILFELIKPFGFSAGQLHDALALMNAHTGAYIKSSTHRLLKNRNWLVLSALHTPEFKTVIIEEGEGHVIFHGGILHLRLSASSEINDEPMKAKLDAKDIRYPLILRKWKTGDYFYPLGMSKKKKLSRFFIDLKLSKNQKEEILVLESDKRIIWIPGYRIDDRFKVKPSPQKILEVEFIKS